MARILFWFFWILDVHCETQSGDVSCTLMTPNGQTIICEEGGAENGAATDVLDVKPSLDARCLMTLRAW